MKKEKKDEQEIYQLSNDYIRVGVTLFGGDAELVKRYRDFGFSSRGEMLRHCLRVAYGAMQVQTSPYNL